MMEIYELCCWVATAIFDSSRVSYAWNILGYGECLCEEIYIGGNDASRWLFERFARTRRDARPYHAGAKFDVPF